MDGLKYTHPQKYYMRLICQWLYYFGLGDCWYEKTERTHKNLYKIWVFLSNFYIYSVLLNELLAHFRTDLTDKESNDLVQLTFAHPSICTKFLAVCYKRNQIQVVLKRFLERSRCVFSSLDVERQSVKAFMKYCVIFASFSLMTMTTFTADAFWRHMKEGVPIEIEVTYYPKPSETGVFFNVLRFLLTFHWWYIVFIMILIDIMAFGSLIFLGFKFKLLRLYFNNLREILESEGDRREAEREFKKGFITGIELHEDLLWCARNIQQSMGHIYSVQVFECVALIVMCLVKFVTNERNLTFLVANSIFILCLAFLTGIYMMAAGDITYEASLVSTAIFHSGWELTRHEDMRVLTVIALQQSQVPVVMTAFGVITLSYTNFISVLRSSYSFFAVLY